MSIPFDAKRPPINRWNNDYIMPGNVGSVGDVNVTPRLRNSDPMMPVRFDQHFINSERLGMNVQNGTSSNVWGSQFPQLVDDHWNVRTGFKTGLGWIHQDLRAPDKLHEPTLGELPQYSWDNRIATNYNAMRTGTMFLPLPGQYGLNKSQTPRGGQMPRIVDQELNGGVFTEPGFVGEKAKKDYGIVDGNIIKTDSEQPKIPKMI